VPRQRFISPTIPSLLLMPLLLLLPIFCLVLSACFALSLLPRFPHYARRRWRQYSAARAHMSPRTMLLLLILLLLLLLLLPPPPLTCESGYSH
jgi:hypothetical protein